MGALFTIWKNTPFVAFLLYTVATISLAIFLERLANVKRSKILPSRWVAIKKAVAEGRIDEALLLLQKDKRETSKVLFNLLHLYAKREITKAEFLQMLNNQLELIYAKLTRGVSFLAISVTLATLLGLIGTVIGLIDIFATFAGESSEAIKLLSKGISTALNSTAAGLIVAIFDYILYWIVRERVSSVFTKVAAELNELAEYLK